MLQSVLGLKSLPKNLDSTDGLAAAVCHFYNDGRIEVGKSYSGWDAFVKQNSPPAPKGGVQSSRSKKGISASDIVDLRKKKS
jgi:crossover junction endodeoxyribonuclease RuvC